MAEDNTTLTLRENPIVFWIIGSILVISGIIFFIINPKSHFLATVDLTLGLVFFLFPKSLTIRADRISGVITLQHRGLLWGSKKEIHLNDITGIQVEESQDSDSTTYRIVVVCKDNQVIPFHSYYSSGLRGKQKKAEQLRSFLGIGDSEGTPTATSNGSPQMVQEKPQEQQEKLTGSPEEEHTTDEVHWKLQTAEMGGSAFTRWFSPDYKFEGGFLFLTQKTAGQKTMAGGLMGGVSKFLFQQALKLYGFNAEELPGLETADLMAPLDARLDPYFSAFTNDPATAHQLLNPWAAAPLADWAIRYPLKVVQTQGIFGQLAILFSPQGIYVSSPGTMIPEAVEELTQLGVALVKANR